MADNTFNENIVRSRMHGLYLSRSCSDIVELSRELLGLHSWFSRNVCFSALIRGADLRGWKTSLTKTWLYRGTLHGVAEDDLPRLLALHEGDKYLEGMFGKALVDRFAEDVLRYMEDGVYSRTEFRQIFAESYEPRVVEAMFSPWGGVFVALARRGKVAFRDMTSRDFDLISAEPTQTAQEVLPDLLKRYFTVYGPATLADAAWFFGFFKTEAKKLNSVPLDGIKSFEAGGKMYYYAERGEVADIPKLTLLSGFDPIIVSYTDRSSILPEQYKARVILKSGICNPTIAVDGRIAGIWNIKKNQPIVEFFESQPKKIVDEATQRVEAIRWRMKYS